MAETPKKNCIVCGDATKNRLVSLVEHFRFIDWPQRAFIRGNFRTFGFRSGLRANLTLMFPWLNTLINWKYRKMNLRIKESDD